MTKAELDRLKYETISFKDIITGGWALKFQAIQLIFRVLLWWTSESERSEDERYM